jgi:hypothetical protein
MRSVRLTVYDEDVVMTKSERVANQEEADLRRLQSEYVAAARNTLTILAVHGPASKRFLEAERKREMIKGQIGKVHKSSCR